MQNNRTFDLNTGDISEAVHLIFSTTDAIQLQELFKFIADQQSSITVDKMRTIQAIFKRKIMEKENIDQVTEKYIDTLNYLTNLILGIQSFRPFVDSLGKPITRHKAQSTMKPETNFAITNLDQIQKVFMNESDYRRHINNLCKTRKGLSIIIEARPDLESELMDQFETLNLLVAALLPDNPKDYPGPASNDEMSNEPGWF
ncbi:MAG: hypothetical protein KDC49_22980 [Saprospiraceae bacterium]|nr:hypothetical protein [Saprospiraceae bacterium]